LNTGPLAGYAIVHFGNDWRAENRTSSHHISEGLSKYLPVLYVSTPGFRAPSVTSRDFGRIVDKLREAPRLPEQVRPNMWAMTMPQLPFRSVPGVPALNRMVGRALLRRAIRHLGFRKLISLFFVPHPAPFARTLGEDLSVYYCTDSHVHLPGVDRAAVERYDRDLTLHSDVVFYCSKKLMEERRDVRPGIIYSPHGVDAAMFGLAADTSLPLAEPLRALRRPVIGYFGSISAWMDVDLVAQLAREHPDWNFVLLGLPSIDVGVLRALPNVLMPGAVPYRTLPDWARGFDVCIAPYLPNPQVINSNPLKIREYLATGKPVVSIWMPEGDQFSGVVHFVKDRAQFAGAIAAALDEGVEARQAERLAAVRDSTWEARAESVFHALEDAARTKRERA